MTRGRGKGGRSWKRRYVPTKSGGVLRWLEGRKKKKKASFRLLSERDGTSDRRKRKGGGL